MVLINILFLCIMIIINVYIGYLSRKKIKENNLVLIKLENFIKKNIKFVFIFFIFVASFLYLWKLDSVPFGLNVDEAGSLYDAMSLSKYGVDRYLYHFPLYFINYGGGQSALYTYLVMIFISLFGCNVFILRFPAALFGICSIIFFYMLLKNEKGSKNAFLGTFVMLVTPFFIMKSRWGLDAYLFISLLLISIFVFFRAINKDKLFLFFLSGILFGITLYTYALSYIIVPLFVLLSCIYLLYIKKVKIKNVIILFIPLFLLSLPLLLMIFINKGLIKSEIITSFFSIPKLWNYRGNELSFSNIKVNLIYLWGVMFINDGLIWNVLPNFCTLYFISIPLAIYGLILSFKNSFLAIKKKIFNLDIVMVLLFVLTFLFALFIESVNINKINCIYIPLVYFISLSLVNVFYISRRSLFIILLMYIFMFFNFTYYYFNIYPKEYGNILLFVSDDFNKSISFAQKIRKDDQYICSDSNVVQSYIYFLIHDKESPYVFNKDSVIINESVVSYKYYIFSSNVINDNYIYIANKKSKLYYDLKNMNFNEKKFNNYVVLYK